MKLKDKTIEALFDMVEKGLDDMIAKGELKTKDDVCMMKELISSHEKLEKMEHAEYSNDMYPRSRNAGYSRDGWYINREDDYRKRGYSYGEPDVDRIAETVRRVMRNEG